MKQKFAKIGLIAHTKRPEAKESLEQLCKHLLENNDLTVLLEDKTAELLGPSALKQYDVATLSQHCDLIIAIGGDGHFLGAARSAIEENIPVIGVNRGRLGFLTDIKPSELTERVDAILAGEYLTEERFLLQAEVHHGSSITTAGAALNDVVVLAGGYGHMIDYEIHIDNHFMCNQRSDGLIIATPTGSTAYSLSAGGPIMHPSMDVITLVPMLPHTLSSRPIVIDGNSVIEVIIKQAPQTIPRVSADGQEPVELSLDSKVVIKKKEEHLKLLHPTDYNYYKTLRTKLSWTTA